MEAAIRTFVPLRRLLLAQAPPRDANAGPPMVTGFILTQEQLMNMELICAALEAQLSVVNMKIVERSSPAGDGSAAGVAHLHIRQELSRPTSPWASCRRTGPWEKGLNGIGEYEVIRVTAAADLAPGPPKPQAPTSWDPSARTGCSRRCSHHHRRR